MQFVLLQYYRVPRPTWAESAMYIELFVVITMCCLNMERQACLWRWKSLSLSSWIIERIIFLRRSQYEDRKQFSSQSSTTSTEVKASGIISDSVKFKKIYHFLKKPIFYLHCFSPASYMCDSKARMIHRLWRTGRGTNIWEWDSKWVHEYDHI